jgi:hypothetical protein
LIRPPFRLRARVAAFTDDEALRLEELLEEARPIIEGLGNTPELWRDAWEAAVEAVEASRGDLQ